MAERFNAPVLKTDVLKGTGGSNPSSSALLKQHRMVLLFFCPLPKFKKHPMFTVYILKSETSYKHYYGHTKDLTQRLKAHNSGKVRSTKSGRPWKVIHQEEFANKSEAYQRELFFKSIDGYNFLREQKII